MTPTPRNLPRRTVLAASGTAVLAVAAACSSDPAPAAGTTSATAATTSAANSSSAAPSSSAAASSSSAAAPTTAAAPASTAAAAPTGTPLASVADVEAAGSVVVGDGENAYLLAASGGTVVAHTAICTHQGCKVNPQGAEALCPCHQSLYNAMTGALLRPAPNSSGQGPLVEKAVVVANGQVYAG